jgi:class 3 adenylate cyclase/tetratricopeptide (TPR) repeat protein
LKAENPMICPECQTENPEGARFCFNCGTALSRPCANCGTLLLAGARFCFNCGHPTEAAPAGPPTPVRAQQDVLQRYIPRELLAKLEAARQGGLMEGERRVVTILFCDVKGSTEAASRLDPEEWSEIINGAFEHMIGPVYRYEGTVARLLGDGLLAFFGAPIAHEDDPQRAVLAGLAIIEAIRGYAQEVRRRWDLDFNVRVGINTGLVVVGAVGSDLRMEYTALGDAINLAARMEQTAAPGTVQIAGPTHKIVEPLFDFEVVDNLELKGLDRPVTAYRVLRPKEEPGRQRGIAGLHSPLVGRQAEQDVLREVVAALRSGEGQIVSIIGDAGLGKSRLLAELRREVEGDPALGGPALGGPALGGPALGGGRWLEGRVLSFESATPFALFSRLLGDYFELDDGQPAASRVSRIADVLDTLMPGQGEALAPFFATLLGLELSAEQAERVRFLEPPHLRGLIFRHIHGLLAAHLARQPLLLVVDDLHWVDPTSLQLLQTLLPLVDQSKLLILAAFRPRRQDPVWLFHEAAERDFAHRHRVLTLNALDGGQSRALVANLLEVEDLPESVRQAILDKAQGNPFFIEEIIRSLLDAGLVVRQNGRWRATREVVDITIPDTLLGVITARLDRLEESTRRIVQAAAVLGREFSVEVLADVAGADDGLAAALAELQRREILLEESALAKRRLLFKHVLTQEAGYNSVLLSNRRELHRRAAESLMVRQPDDAATIARHWLGAQQPARALPYLVTAGDNASRAYATDEAIDFYGRALELADDDSELEPVRRAYEGLGNALSFANRGPEAMEAYGKLLALGEARDDAPTQISALNKLASTAGLRMGRFSEADSYLARAETLVKRARDSAGRAEATLVRCMMCAVQADFDGIVHHMGELVDTASDGVTGEYRAMGLDHVSSSLLWLTRFDEAQKRAEEGLAVAREAGARLSEAWFQVGVLPMCAVRNGDFELARAYLAEGAPLATRIGALEPQVWGNWLLGEMAQWAGDYEAALTYGQAAVDLALPLEEHMPWTVVPPLGSLGSAYLWLSRRFREQTLKLHHHALRLLESPTGTAMGAAAWADLGHCALKLGDLELAEQSFEKGLNVPTMFMHLERPRLLAGSALLALARKEPERAVALAREGLAFAQEKQMRHIYPLALLALGQAQSASGQYESALATFQQAEEAALSLGMRSYLWQARRESARALEAAGRRPEADAARARARETIESIANGIQDRELREAHLEETLREVMG